MNIETLQTDQELVTATLIDKNKFSLIIHKYEEQLLRYVRRLGCRDEGDASDVLQEIFIKVFMNLNDYDQRLKFSSWIYRIAHNETISFFRKKNSRPRVLDYSTEDAAIFFENLADENNPIDIIQNSDDVQIVKEIFSVIDTKYREALTLRFLEEKTYEEIGDILRIPEGTVATLISRGKKEFAQLWGSKMKK